MSEPNTQFYHCAICNSVFKAPMPLPDGEVCANCGRAPFAEQAFNSISEMENVFDSGASHGLPGQDVADFVSMQKAKRQRQGKWVIALWLLLLVVGGGIVFYNREIEKPVGEELSGLVKQEQEYQKNLATSTGEAFRVFNKFLLARDANEQSEYVVGGVRKILSLEQHENSIDLVVPSRPLKLIANSYSDDGELPRVELIIEDARERNFDVVMWKDDSKWLLDWEQYVRYAQDDWTRFLVDKSIGSPKIFRLYVRRRHIGTGGEHDKLQLIFYKPKMEAGERTQESPRVDVPPDSPFFTQLGTAFDTEINRKNEVQKSVVGRLDKAGLLRVKVTLDWQQGTDDNRVMVLKGLDSMHWFELDPVKVLTPAQAQ
ncbi:MAG: hypothetical protein ABGY95_00345 [Rubritalea sp.]|uniref:hypothetical protein n=1 Tax=Rubritalea sp. TaxID=2109375 RepID=UPI0032426F5E